MHIADWLLIKKDRKRAEWKTLTKLVVIFQAASIQPCFGDIGWGGRELFGAKQRSRMAQIEINRKTLQGGVAWIYFQRFRCKVKALLSNLNIYFVSRKYQFWGSVFLKELNQIPGIFLLQLLLFVAELYRLAPPAPELTGKDSRPVASKMFTLCHCVGRRVLQSSPCLAL